MNRKKIPLHHNIPLLLAIIGAVTLSFESYLSLHGKSLCKTSACDIVSNYISVSEALLVAAGAILFWVLALLLYFSNRHTKILPVVTLLLLLSLAFDGTLIGFQFFTIQQKCLICVFVAVCLLTVSVLHFLLQKRYTLLMCCVLVWCGTFGANSILRMPMPQGSYHNMAFYATGVNAVQTEGHLPRMTLIMSMNCPHCLEVLESLAKKYPLDYNFQIATIDSDQQSLSKIGAFLEQVPYVSNPFSLLKNLKMNNIANSRPVDKKLEARAQNSLYFLSNIGISTIPVLFSELNNNDKRILIGSSEIINFLDTATPP